MSQPKSLSNQVFAAVQTGDPAQLDAVLTDGPNTILDPIEKQTALHSMLIYDSGTKYHIFIEHLLRQGADPNHRECGITPAHLALQTTTAFQTLKLLQAYGADFHIPGPTGRSIVSEAILKQSRDPRVLALLLDAGVTLPDNEKADVDKLLEYKFPEVRAVLRALLDGTFTGEVPASIPRRTDPTPIDWKAAIEEALELLIRSGYGSDDEVVRQFLEIAEGEAGTATTDALRAQWHQQVRDALATQYAEEARWLHVTTNDRIDRAFAELQRRGIIALQNAGFTWSDGHEDVNDAKERHPAAHGWTFFHGQDVERGVNGEGLLLYFGPIGPDETHESDGQRVGETICAVMHSHGIKTTWDGKLNSRIQILPFVWQRRRGTPPPATAETTDTATEPDDTPIRGTEGMSYEEIEEAVANGARFMVFPYVISLFITFERYSEVRLVRPGEPTRLAALPYLLPTLLLGWWSFPWGPISSVGALYHILRGGKDVTDEVLSD